MTTPEVIEARWARTNAVQRAAIAQSQDVYVRYGEALDAGPANPKRRKKVSKSLRAFCETYGGDAFTLSWSPFQLAAIEKIEKAVFHGEVFAFAMPRGGGKTTLCHWAVTWAACCGHSPYVVYIGATLDAASRRLKNLKTTLRFNELLAQDFPEVCLPVQHIKGEARRAGGQKFKGEPTMIGWQANQIILANIPVPYAKSSGTIIDVAGIEGDIRGRNHERADGTIVRPTLAIVDDPQTRESAKSPTQSSTREAVIAGDVKYMAGPEKPIGVVMPCTVIAKDDLADRMLDNKTHPEWQGERSKMMITFPSNAKLWERYSEIRNQSFLNGGRGQEATEFYEDNREDMDEGAEVSWPLRYFPDELSAVQHAMNLRFLDETAFMAEYQNEPIWGQVDEVTLPTMEEIATKTNGVKQGKVPDEADVLTMFVDISQKVLWWTVVGWGKDMTGCVVDYGVYPQQKTRYTTLASAKRTLQNTAPGAGLEAAILNGLQELIEKSVEREWETESGGVMRIGCCLVDAQWNPSTDIVYSFCRRSKASPVLYPSHGIGITAGNKPLIEPTDKKKAGERWGEQWKIKLGRSKVRSVRYDTNYWKTVLYSRLAVPTGDAGALTIYEGTQTHHRMLAEQVTAEYCVRTEGRGRVVDQWSIRPHKSDNHFLDCLVGCALGASILGVRREGDAVQAAARQFVRKRKKMSYLS